MDFEERIAKLTHGVTDPEKKIETLLEKAYDLRRTDVPFLKECSEYCIRESQKIGFKRGIAIGLSNQGMYYYVEGNPQQALGLLDQAVALCLGDKSIDALSYAWSIPLLRSYNLMGIIANDQGDLNRALALYDNAYKLANRFGNADQMSMIRGNLANIYSDLGQYADAEKIFREEIQDSQKETDPIVSTINLANLGRVLNLSGKTDEAEDLLQRSLNLAEELDAPSIRAAILDELGNLEMTRGNLDLAEDYFRKCAALNEYQDLLAYVGTQASLVNLLFKREKFQDAEKLLEKTIPIAEKEKMQVPLSQLLLQQSQLLEKTERPAEALVALKRFVNLTTSVDGQKIIDKAVELELSRLREFRNNLDKVWLTGSQIASLPDLESTFREMMKLIFDLTEADFVEIALKNEAGLEYLSSQKGQNAFKSSFRPVDEFQKLVALCVRNNQEIIIQDLEHELFQYFDILDVKKFESIAEAPQTLFCFPLSILGVPIGALSIQYKKKNLAAFDRRISYRLLAQFLTVGLTNMNRLKEINREKELLAEAASYDALTGLLNRRSLSERTTASYRNAVRQKLSCFIVVIDIDNFKGINDTWGHLAGDQALKLVSNHLKNIFKRATDHIGRFGGDEFVILLMDTPKKSVLSLVEKLRKEVALTSYPTEKGDVKLTISIGVSGRNPGDDYPPDYSVILDEADKALYQAKKHGQNQCVLYDKKV